MSCSYKCHCGNDLVDDYSTKVGWCYECGGPDTRPSPKAREILGAQVGEHGPRCWINPESHIPEYEDLSPAFWHFDATKTLRLEYCPVTELEEERAKRVELEQKLNSLLAKEK